MYRTLEMIREKMIDVEKLNDQIARISVAYKGPNYDGMPKGGNADAGDKIARMMDVKKDLEKRKRELNHEIEMLKRDAEKDIADFPSHLNRFCKFFYMTTCSVEEVCAIIERDESTFYRYKREVKKMLGK